MSRLVGTWKALGAERWLQRPESPSQIGLKCAQLRERDGLFVSCRHWQLRTGHVLELRWLPRYVDAPIDLIVWKPAGEHPAVTAEGFPVLGSGESYAATSLRSAVIAARCDLVVPRRAAIPIAERNTCRVCGCTELDCTHCVERTGLSCYWVEPHLCSACNEQIVALVVNPDEIEALAEGLRRRESRSEIEPPDAAEQREIDWLWSVIREAESREP